LYISAMLLLFLLFVSSWNVAAAHYLMPALPFIFLLCGKGITVIGKSKKKLNFSLILILLFYSNIPSLINTFKMLSAKDTRLISIAWIRNNIPQGSRILRFAHTPEFSQNDPYYVKVDCENLLLKSSPNELLKDYDYLILSRYNTKLTKLENSLRKRGRLIKVFNSPNTKYPHNPVITIFKRAE